MSGNGIQDCRNMAPQTASEKSPRDEIVRLGQELEQARVALEDAHSEIAILTQASAQQELRAKADQAARRQAEEDGRAHAHATNLAIAATDRADFKLREMLEETTLLTEELRAANAALLVANQRLDQQVAQRTAELHTANTNLASLNAELQRRVEQETAARIAAQADLFQMQKLEAIGQLTGGIAHDFNNLLSVIINSLQLLGRVEQPDHRARILRRTEEAAWRGAQLTQRLLALARRQTLHPERLDLAQRVDGLRDLISHSLRDDIEVRLEIAADLWPIEADSTALELAVLNLAVNARDAMPKGGLLVLFARNRPVAQAAAEQLQIDVGEYIELAVQDTGVGMAPEVLERVFEPFFTTKAHAGTGLGLAQVFGFAKQSGGTAKAESAPGGGATIRLLLPRSTRQEEPRTVQPATPAHRDARGHLSVLVVEDDDELAATVLDMMTQLGHSATRVVTVASALAVVTGSEQVDLVFSDVLLPGGGSGLDLAREIEARGIAVPVILTSGYGGGVTQRLAAAKLPFLRKPYRIEALRQAISDALAVPIPRG
jgi:signal transduction histidine kinase